MIQINMVLCQLVIEQLSHYYNPYNNIGPDEIFFFFFKGLGFFFHFHLLEFCFVCWVFLTRASEPASAVDMFPVHIMLTPPAAGHTRIVSEAALCFRVSDEFCSFFASFSSVSGRHYDRFTLFGRG